MKRIEVCRMCDAKVFWVNARGGRIPLDQVETAEGEYSLRSVSTKYSDVLPSLFAEPKSSFVTHGYADHRRNCKPKALAKPTR